MMRILIISREAWRNEQNGGNVLSNIFEGFDAKFAQIYCTDMLPSNDVCKLYYQLTDKMMIDNIFHGKKPGRVLQYQEYPRSNNSVEGYSSAKRINMESIRVARELGWKLARWNEDEISTFVNNFKPDVIFAPCYGSHYMIRLTKLVSSFCSAPIISYISDDFYTNRQWRLSPVYWINHFLLRRNVREVFGLYELTYTMTEEQKTQCELDFGARMKILRKSGSFQTDREKRDVGKPIRFVYAGGIYLNRWKTLAALADAMREIDPDGKMFTLDIYTGNEISKSMATKLDDGVSSAIHGVIGSDELKEIYTKSDIALHVESFDAKNKAVTRMSFSTKIIDCLDSGCAVMAICDKSQAGLAYLNRNNAGICITSLSDIKNTLFEIGNNTSTLIDYQHRAFTLGRKNHLKENVERDIKTDFEAIMKSSALAKMNGDA